MAKHTIEQLNSIVDMFESEEMQTVLEDINECIRSGRDSLEVYSGGDSIANDSYLKGQIAGLRSITRLEEEYRNDLKLLREEDNKTK